MKQISGVVANKYRVGEFKCAVPPGFRMLRVCKIPLIYHRKNAENIPPSPKKMMDFFAVETKI